MHMCFLRAPDIPYSVRISKKECLALKAVESPVINAKGPSAPPTPASHQGRSRGGVGPGRPWGEQSEQEARTPSVQGLGPSSREIPASRLLLPRLLAAVLDASSITLSSPSTDPARGGLVRTSLSLFFICKLFFIELQLNSLELKLFLAVSLLPSMARKSLKL